MKGFTAKKIAVLAVMTALLVCGKLALNFIPNVEVITLFCALFGYVFGLWALLPVAVFCLLSGAYWGYNIWVVTYLIYFSAVVTVFWLLSKKSIDRPYVTSPIVALLTFGFGILDAFMVTILSGFDNFLYRFSFYYGNGIVFVIIHVMSNAVIVALIFSPLSKLLQKLKLEMEI